MTSHSSLRLTPASLIAAACLAAMGCQQRPESPIIDPQSLSFFDYQEAEKRFNQAFRAKDFDTLIDIFPPEFWANAARADGMTVTDYQTDFAEEIILAGFGHRQGNPADFGEIFVRAPSSSVQTAAPVETICAPGYLFGKIDYYKSDPVDQSAVISVLYALYDEEIDAWFFVPAHSGILNHYTDYPALQRDFIENYSPPRSNIRGIYDEVVGAPSEPCKFFP